MKINVENKSFSLEDFDKIASKLRKLLEEKSDEYNKEFEVFDYFIYGVKSINTMLWIKTLRELDTTDGSTKNLDDLVIYSMFKIKWLEKFKGLETVKEEIS
jgi:hypothetical protein